MTTMGRLGLVALELVRSLWVRLAGIGQDADGGHNTLVVDRLTGLLFHSSFLVDEHEAREGTSLSEYGEKVALES